MTNRFVLLALLIIFPAFCRGELAVNPIFADGTVLQRDTPVAIWGTADPGGQVAVSFREEREIVTVGADGNWKASLIRMNASTQSATLRVESGGETIEIANVYSDNPGRLWRERIEPLVGYSVAGMIWYQGERNSKAGEAAASAYNDLLVALITSWRSAWGQGDLRFLAVQLPPFAKGGENWAIVQQCQATAVKRVSNVELIDLTDLPDEGQLHPPNKLRVGERLADRVAPD